MPDSVPPSPEPPPFTVWQALADEFHEIRGETLIPTKDDYANGALKARLSALCLSGGGIRSAAFSLGVLQALARTRLLSRFDYLSTVSGGGFAGSWLSALIHQSGSAAAAEDVLTSVPPRPQPSSLRDYTNYLTPHTGALSLDTWASVVIYLRNVLLNWLVFAPAFALAVLAAIFYRTAVWQIGMWPGSIWIVGLAALVLTTAVARACMASPSHRKSSEGQIAYVSLREILATIVAPAWFWASVTPMALSNWYARDNIGTGLLVPAIYAAAMIAGYALASVLQADARLYIRNFWSWFISTLASAALIWGGVRLGRLVPEKDQAEMLVILGPLWLILANVLQATLHVGLRPATYFGDLDREWLARLSAQKLQPVILWALFAFCCLSLPRFAFEGSWNRPFWATGLMTFIAGPAGAWIAKQAKARVEALITTPNLTDRSLAVLLPALAILFAVGLFVLFGGLMANVLGHLQILGMDLGVRAGSTGSFWYAVLPIPLQIGLIAVMVAIIWFTGKHINVNRFSMHGVYRGRLTRAFLGSARAGERHPDPFTGFDPWDNPRLAKLHTGVKKLFHVVNVTLNLTRTTRLAWAERKAASFTMTSLACGSDALKGHIQAQTDDSPRAYVLTGSYAGNEHETGPEEKPSGITLGTAMTLSGAAVSPNWGYHSSPALAFLMTLFNVRLGAWLPNPAIVTDPHMLQRSAPTFSLWPFLHELLGIASDSSANIYLSDGGHFENLGLYEMLRRRCRLIVVVDAGQDPNAKFTDLGNAIRKASIDLDVEVEMRPMRIYSREMMEKLPDADRVKALGFAIGDIHYPEGEEGWIIYVKPSWLPDIPAEVRAYGALHPEFPHDTTAEQWFTESQFESYRALGEFQMRQLLKCVSVKAGPGADLEKLFNTVCSDAPMPSAPANEVCPQSPEQPVHEPTS
jgi:hypothetical protein